MVPDNPRELHPLNSVKAKLTVLVLAKTMFLSADDITVTVVSAL